MASENAWPNAGGTLDQSASFLDAHRFIQSLQNKLLSPKKTNV